MWKEGKREGPGKMTYMNGDSFEGDFSDNWQNGKGKWCIGGSFDYEGKWKLEFPDGFILEYEF